ncbi:MAG: hypothetical protein H6Q10_2113 [Acidobacteria bacterium]|nr:hypothetical protein [Acidobacteriota bacterium]
MVRARLLLLAAALACGGSLAALPAARPADGPALDAAQTTKKPAPKAPSSSTAKQPASQSTQGRRVEPPEVVCPQVLGNGVGSRLRFCDVMTGLDPALGILVGFPPHTGPLTLSFDLHNRHTYSEQETRAGRAFARYTATIGILTMDGKLLTRGVVQSEFRTARDLFDRIGGGAGPGGVKAVAPTGVERIVLDVPAGVNQVSILGEKLSVMGLEGTDLFTSANRPVAVVSNFSIDYKPAKPPAKKPTRRR